MSMSWKEYTEKFPQPYDISHPFAWRDDPLYDEKRKANLKWQADYYVQGYSPDAPSVFMLMNPFINGGWYYGLRGPEWIPDPTPGKQIDWAAEKAAGRPVIGPF